MINEARDTFKNSKICEGCYEYSFLVGDWKVDEIQLSTRQKNPLT